MRLTHQYFKQKAKQLRDLLKSNKIFLNMVIHDCRNPTNQIKFAIDMAFTTIKEVESKTRNLEGMLLQTTDNLLTDFKQLATEVIEENKSLQKNLVELESIVNENPLFNSRCMIMKRILELEKENEVLKKEVSNCSCKVKKEDREKIDKIYQFYKNNQAMYASFSIGQMKQETIRTDMVEAGDSDDEEDFKIAQWLELNKNECESNDIGVLNNSSKTKRSVQVQTDFIFG